ncbi:hypothetical protein BV22DRAFT_766060 [Leucogyrophana mollusca]|uniref:Uncharacterized protein n=1 Tax=Leucogyrophana mollusca TaxID=85980 RepID=A0ACB8B6P0_9AGAM|nr:hypothetical protein BV22DRAFT_766060 [Leucogyrophana mollusca]
MTLFFAVVYISVHSWIQYTLRSLIPLSIISTSGLFLIDVDHAVYYHWDTSISFHNRRLLTRLLTISSGSESTGQNVLYAYDTTARPQARKRSAKKSPHPKERKV